MQGWESEFGMGAGGVGGKYKPNGGVRRGWEGVSISQEGGQGGFGGGGVQ